jgi:alpha-beta hydrolase superfamily lysophospholipase
MQHHAFNISSRDSTPIFVNHWSGEQAPKGVVMLVHGLAEHSGRYDRLAKALTTAGLSVFALDLRGHGQTAKNGLIGHYADHGGWQKLIDDVESLNHHIQKQHPKLPIVLFGHSMGSYISQAYLMQHQGTVTAAVFSGSNFQPAALYKVAGWIARFERLRQGPTGRSALLNFLSFGSFNKAFKPARTEFDWLSRDPVEVDKYIQDPLCGFLCTNQLWIDLLGGLETLSAAANVDKIDPALPIYVFGGSRDPVSDGKRLGDLAIALQRNGRKVLTLKIYPEARHELLNETNRDAVTNDLIAWLKSM